MFFMQRFTMTAILLLPFVLTGCGASQQSQLQNTNQSVVGEDIREVTVNKGTLPAFLKDVKPEIAAVYANAPAHKELLKNIPCYCGCGESAGHQDNLQCFVHETRANGSIQWDSHGTTCDTCLNIASEAIGMENQGKTTKEIRQYIDEKYKQGYAKPTATPMPM